MPTEREDILLCEIDALTEMRLGNLLDVYTVWDNEWLDKVRFEKGWRDLAATLYFNTIDIRRCEMAPGRGRTCAQEMIMILQQRYPNYTAACLIEKLITLGRTDAADILDKAIVKICKVSSPQYLYIVDIYD